MMAVDESHQKEVCLAGEFTTCFRGGEKSAHRADNDDIGKDTG
jgi:hypothetical protein